MNRDKSYESSAKGFAVAIAGLLLTIAFCIGMGAAP